MTLRQDHANYNVEPSSVAMDKDSEYATLGIHQDIFDCGEVLAEDVCEKFLLHGTTSENAEEIVRWGFDHRTCDRGMYGNGVYFAGAACKSHQYTCDQHRDAACNCATRRTLIIARVLLGDSFQTPAVRKGKGRPPERGRNRGTFDSVNVMPGPVHGHQHGHQAHQEFVIFDLHQAYPAFVVWYRP